LVQGKFRHQLSCSAKDLRKALGSGFRSFFCVRGKIFCGRAQKEAAVHGGNHKDALGDRAWGGKEDGVDEVSRGFIKKDVFPAARNEGGKRNSGHLGNSVGEKPGGVYDGIHEIEPFLSAQGLHSAIFDLDPKDFLTQMKFGSVFLGIFRGGLGYLPRCGDPDL
jgi:hypothetical protein